MNIANHPEPSHDVIKNLRKLSTRMVLFQQFAAHSLGLAHTDFKTADILNETGPITAGELAKITGLTTGSVSALIDRLEQAGLVKREKDPKDRRRVIIVLVKNKHSLIRQHFLPLNIAMTELCSHYSEAELALINEFITQTSKIHEKEIQRLSKAETE